MAWGPAGAGPTGELPAAPAVLAPAPARPGRGPPRPVAGDHDLRRRRRRPELPAPGVRAKPATTPAIARSSGAIRLTSPASAALRPRRSPPSLSRIRSSTRSTGRDAGHGGARVRGGSPCLLSARPPSARRISRRVRSSRPSRPDRPGGPSTGHVRTPATRTAPRCIARVRRDPPQPAAPSAPGRPAGHALRPAEMPRGPVDRGGPRPGRRPDLGTSRGRRSGPIVTSFRRFSMIRLQ